MNHDPSPEPIFLLNELPNFPPPNSPDDRFPFWRRLLLCITIASIVGLFGGLRAMRKDGNLATDVATVAIFAAASAAMGAVGGLVWIGADYLEFRNQRGLRTSPLFAHFFCMGVTSVMIWSVILFPLVIIGAIVISILSVL